MMRYCLVQPMSSEGEFNITAATVGLMHLLSVLVLSCQSVTSMKV